MPARLPLRPHLSVDELEQRYRACRDPVARSRWHIVWLVGQGHSGAAAARLTSYSETWVRPLIHRYNDDGPAGLADDRHAHPGRAPLVSTEMREALRARLADPPPDGGLWTGPKVATWLSERLNRAIHPQRGWETLRGLGFTPQRPRPRATRADPVAQDAFKKGGLEQAVNAVRTAHPRATVTVWAEDEHRLIPIVRRVWAPRGTRPTAPSDRRYAWLYVYGLVRPTTGQSWWCLLPSMRTAAMSAALAAFAHDEGIDATRRVVIVWDGAGRHTSGELAVPEGIDLVALPPSSPELQPAERVWPLVNEAVANRSFATLDALEAVLVDRCRTLREDRPTIRDLTRYRWWPSDAPLAIRN